MPAARKSQVAGSPARRRRSRRDERAVIETAFENAEACGRFLDRKSPHELLDLFEASDPLRIAERSSRYLWTEGLLLEPDRLTHKAAARIARHAHDRPRHVSLDRWLWSCLARAAADILHEDAERLASDTEVREPWAPQHVFIRDALGHDEVNALRVCAAFNRQRRLERQAFFALIMERRPVEEVLDAGFGPAKWLRAACLQGLDLLLGFEPDPEVGEQEELDS